MEENLKKLLLKDLCARLPYGVWVKDIHTNIIRKLSNTVVHPLYDGNNIKDYICSIKMFDDHYVDIEYIRLFLYPFSCMTEEQKKELNILRTYVSLNKNKEYLLFDWLNKNHFDYRGLIEKGLAIDCSNLNIY